MNEIESRDLKKSNIEAVILRIALASIIIVAVVFLMVGSVFFKWAFELSRDWDIRMTSPFNGNIYVKSQYSGYKILFISNLALGASFIMYGMVTVLECITAWMIIKWKQKIPKYLFNWLMIKICITYVIFICSGSVIKWIIS